MGSAAAVRGRCGNSRKPETRSIPGKLYSVGRPASHAWFRISGLGLFFAPCNFGMVSCHTRRIVSAAGIGPMLDAAFRYVLSKPPHLASASGSVEALTGFNQDDFLVVEGRPAGPRSRRRPSLLRFSVFFRLATTARQLQLPASSCRRKDPLREGQVRTNAYGERRS